MATSKMLFFLLVMAISTARSNCTSAQQLPDKKDSVTGIGRFLGKKILIVYLTRTGNTEAIARMIQKEVGGKLVALELINPYPRDYKAQVDQVVRENESGFLPPLKTRIDRIDQYDAVFLGFPTWAMQMPPPMKSFLKQYDLGGKTVLPFNTNAGYGVGSGFQTVIDLCPRSKVLEGFSIKGGIERDGVLFVMEGKKAVEAQRLLTKWLNELKP